MKKIAPLDSSRVLPATSRRKHQCEAFATLMLAQKLGLNPTLNPTLKAAIKGVCLACLCLSGGGCATDFGDAGYQKPHGLARVTRDEFDALRSPGERTTRYLADAQETLTTRPNHYEALVEQSQDGVSQASHFWDSVLGRPARKGLGDGQRRP